VVFVYEKQKLPQKQEYMGVIEYIGVIDYVPPLYYIEKISTTHGHKGPSLALCKNGPIFEIAASSQDYYYDQENI
jgi:hypothetical protein